MSAQPIPINEEMLSASELVARFTGEELRAAAEETSERYEGLVLAAAVRIAMRRTGLNARRLAATAGLSSSTLSRWTFGMPMESATARRALTMLIFAMEPDR